MPICIVKKGWSKNGRYYSEAVLRKAARIYRAGTHNLWNHPGPAKLREQPGTDLNDIASVLVEDARYLDEGDTDAFDGPGLYSRAKPISAYRDRILELAPSIGLSHRVTGRQTPGMAEGRRGKIVTEIFDPVMVRGLPPITVDWVAHPAAGGGALVEEEEIDTMTETEITETVTPDQNAGGAPLDEEIAAKNATIAALQKEIATMKADKAMAEATAVLDEALATSGLPEAAVTRLRTIVPPDATIPLEDYRNAVQRAVVEEDTYIKAVTMSATTPEEPAPEGDEDAGEDTTPAAEAVTQGLPNQGVKVTESENYLRLSRELRAGMVGR